MWANLARQLYQVGDDGWVNLFRGDAIPQGQSPSSVDWTQNRLHENSNIRLAPFEYWTTTPQVAEQHYAARWGSNPASPSGDNPTYPAVSSGQFRPRRVFDYSSLGEAFTWGDFIRHMASQSGENPDQLMERFSPHMPQRYNPWEMTQEPPFRGRDLWDNSPSIEEWQRSMQTGEVFQRQFNYGDVDATVPAWYPLRNHPGSQYRSYPDAAGLELAAWLQQHGFDAARYAEEGTQHYALLNTPQTQVERRNVQPLRPVPYYGPSFDVPGAQVHPPGSPAWEHAVSGTARHPQRYLPLQGNPLQAFASLASGLFGGGLGMGAQLANPSPLTVDPWTLLLEQAGGSAFMAPSQIQQYMPDPETIRGPVHSAR